MAKPKTEPEPEAPSRPAEYTVVARRYRPQQFDQLIGQESTAQALKNALSSSRVAHAYLFTGARGVGKTSCARILAKALNCEHGPTPTPCDKCPICLSIQSGEDVDVIEIDGASNGRVDEIRDIRQNVQFRPSRGRFKIYIIDEVHMVTTAAFNALLKTLEEPPAGVKFIFATTEVQKIPITILSRCQRFDFGMIAVKKIADHLRLIVKQEKLEADDAALDLLARRAGGSMRDAESLLDQLLAFGERITPALVCKLLGTAPADRVEGIAKAAFAKDPPTALALLADSVQEGAQLGEVVDQLVEFWRDLLIVATCGREAPSLNNPPEALAPLAAGTSIETILSGLDVLTAAKSRLRMTGYGKTVVEMAIVRLARLDDLVNLAGLWSAAQRGSPPPSETRNSGSVRSGEPVPEKKNPASPPPAGPVRLTAQSLQVVWTEVLQRLGPMFAGDLERGGLPAIIGPNQLVIRFPSGYNRQYLACADAAKTTRIQETLNKVAGENWSVRVELTADAAPIGPAAIVEPAKPAAVDPLIEALQTTLDARLLQMDNGFGDAVVAVPNDDAVEVAPEED